MIFSVVYLAVRRLLGCLMVLARREVSKDAELLVLRHENAVLRRQISRVRYQPADRLWLAALSRLIPRRRWGQVFAVTPATLLTWHQRLVTRTWDYTSRRRPGRPSTAPAIRNLVIRMATENLFVLLAASGLLAQFGLQAIVNLASTLHLMPTKGMTLPFISYGGSSLVALGVAMGMILALTRRRRDQEGLGA